MPRVHTISGAPVQFQAPSATRIPTLGDTDTNQPLDFGPYNRLARHLTIISFGALGAAGAAAAFRPRSRAMAAVGAGAGALLVGLLGNVLAGKLIKPDIVLAVAPPPTPQAPPS